MTKKPQATNQWGSKGLVRRDKPAEQKRMEKRKNAGMALAPEYACMEYSRFVQTGGKSKFKLHPTNLFGKAIDPDSNLEGLRREFLYPPFSVLNSREGSWQRRKRMWNRLNVKAVGDETLDERSGGDPVLCELMCRWWCPGGGLVVDPFAGSSSWGIVTHVSGFDYFGVDVNPNQVAANRLASTKLFGEIGPVWHCGDSREINHIIPHRDVDMILSCPPYGNLEVYSDDPRDLSTMDYPRFLKAYRTVIRRTCSLLKEDRFAVWVVGEIRDSDRKGSPYRCFVPDTVRYFEDAGLAYYNELVLVTAVGSLPVRARRSFKVSRKIGPTHQKVLIFVKGDPRKAAEACNG